MNVDQLFEAVGEVSPEKLLHSEESRRVRRHGAVRILSVLAAVVAVLAAMTLVVNAATEGAVLNTLRQWFNGEPVQADDPQLKNTESDYWDWEYMAARTGENGESLLIQRSRSNENGTELGVIMQISRVEERAGKIILFYSGDEIDLTEPLGRADKCVVDYIIRSPEGLIESHVLITVQRDTDGQYYVFTEPAK